MEASSHAKTSSRGKFQAKWAEGSHAAIPLGPFSGFFSWIVPYYISPKYIVVGGISRIDDLEIRVT